MDTAEAKRLLRTRLTEFANVPYHLLAERIGSREHEEIRSDTGKVYFVEIQILWDGKPGKTIRVVGDIDDGGLRGIVPITDSILVDQGGG